MQTVVRDVKDIQFVSNSQLTGRSASPYQVVRDVKDIQFVSNSLSDGDEGCHLDCLTTSTETSLPSFAHQIYMQIVAVPPWISRFPLPFHATRKQRRSLLQLYSGRPFFLANMTQMQRAILIVQSCCYYRKSSGYVINL